MLPESSSGRLARVREPGAGSVLAVGPRTGPSTPPQHEGDTVAAAVVQAGHYGGYSELIAVPDTALLRVPDRYSLPEAATLPMNGLTAIVSLRALALPPGS